MPEVFSTQQFLEVAQIKEGVMLLKNKALRGILMISSLNFALKSEEEQNAVLFQFQDFLNSLDFSVEIIVQSRRLNITLYLDKLKQLEDKQKDELLKLQTAEYRRFIEELVRGGTIMTKNFFVVIPFTMMEAQVKEGMKSQHFLKPTEMLGPLTEEHFQRCKTQLWQRLEFVALGLRRCGLKAVPLNTPELVELFWSAHHPEEAEVGYYPPLPQELIA